MSHSDRHALSEVHSTTGGCELDLEADRLHEECGVFGIYGPGHDAYRPAFPV